MSAQDRKINYLSLLYEQGHYRKVVKKSERLIHKKGYDKNAKVFLYQSAALAKLSINHNYTDIHSDALASSFEAYRVYYDLDKPNKFINKEEQLFATLREMYKGKIDESNNDEQFLLLKIKRNNSQHDIVKQKIEIKKKGDEKVINNKTQVIDTSSINNNVTENTLSLPDRIIAYAETYMGVPYLYGGVTEKGFDCSGYTKHVLETFGYKLPRSARHQKAELKKVKLKEAQKGDLVFFGKSKHNVTHVGLVVSEKGEELTMIHASSSKGIMISNVATNTYWKPKLISAARVIE